MTLDLNRFRIPVLFLALCILFLSACRPDLPTQPPAPVPIRDAVVAPGTVLVITRPDGTRFSFTRDDIDNLQISECTIAGKNFKGPHLFTILKSAGVEDFSRIIVNGKEGSAHIEKEKIYDTMIIDTISQRGELRFVTDTLPQDQWLSAVNLIEAE